MPKVHIPASVDELTANLDGINRLLTAKQWERAAIVYAWTEPGAGQGERTDIGGKSPQGLSSRAFADLGITGLRDPKQVRLYRAAWESAADDGQASLDIQPGDDVDLPTLPWKDHFGEPTGDVQERVFRQVVRDPERFHAALRDNPEVATELAERIVETPMARVPVEAKLASPITPREPTIQSPARRDYREELVRGINLLIPVLRAMQRGDWVPSPAEELLIHSLGLLLSEPDAEPSEDLFSQIDTFLKEQVS